MNSIAGPFEIDWTRENLEQVTRTIIKKLNAEIHSQPAIEGLLELKQQSGFDSADVERIELEIFEVAYNIIGGGEEGDKRRVETKKQADHRLPYLLSVALLDGRIMPEQYGPERLGREDVQSLLTRIDVRPNEFCSSRFPTEMPCLLNVRLRDGRILRIEKSDYEGFVSRPFNWQAAVRKFNRLTGALCDSSAANEIADAVANLEHVHIRDLVRALERIHEL